LAGRQRALVLEQWRVSERGSMVAAGMRRLSSAEAPRVMATPKTPIQKTLPISLVKTAMFSMRASVDYSHTNNI